MKREVKDDGALCAKQVCIVAVLVLAAGLFGYLGACADNGLEVRKLEWRLAYKEERIERCERDLKAIEGVEAPPKATSK